MRTCGIEVSMSMSLISHITPLVNNSKTLPHIHTNQITEMYTNISNHIVLIFMDHYNILYNIALLYTGVLLSIIHIILTLKNN